MALKKTLCISAKFTLEEYRDIVARAEQAGLNLAQYTRRELLAGVALSPDARLLAGEILVFQEKMLQLALAQEEVSREQVQKITRAAEDSREILITAALQKRAKRRALLPPSGERATHHEQELIV